ncbi:MAG: ESPR domain-containing protein [Acidaminococcaceae bacterium]|nr:ESPR domain-containing protein [Acidaminococcaceae bacterium]
MNKVYKIIWNRAKNCYVVASELAKNRTKAPKSGVISRTIVAGVMASICCFGAMNSTYAETAGDYGLVGCVPVYADGDHTIHVGWDAKGALYAFANVGYSNLGINKDLFEKPGFIGTSFADLVTVSHQDIYDALSVGNGLVKADNKISAKAGNGITVGTGGITVKAGNNVTVNESGINVTGTGTVASGNTGLISGGTAYSELRASANGNYVNLNCKI